MSVQRGFARAGNAIEAQEAKMFIHPIALGALVFFGLAALAPYDPKDMKLWRARATLILMAAVAAMVSVW